MDAKWPATHEVPAHEAPLVAVGSPAALQYVPDGRLDVNVAVHAESALLMAMYPSAPRPKAMRFAAGDTQLFNAADATVFLNPTIAPNVRCWHNQPFVPPELEQVPVPAQKPVMSGERVDNLCADKPPLGAPASVEEKL